ncbi:V-type proton ATPase subunit d (VATL2) [Vairimorpha necatrix]|uniref:V-type proton ATPase subunit d (VATL2) n=1 Tax=Vairimorpha necatrix TaxID=6039 RepID=A0AAX4JF94_9MICR
MNYEFETTEEYGYLISSIFGKKLCLYKEEDYNSLKQCENLEEFSIKLMKNYKFITEDMELTKNEIKKRLNMTLFYEYKSCLKSCQTDLLEIILNYWIGSHKIHNFFFLLQSKIADPDLEKSFEKIEIGHFDALKTLKFCKDMHDVRIYCVENSFLRNYFYKLKWATEFKDNDFQNSQALFLKYLMEDTFLQLKNREIFMKEILKTEADRYIVDLTINTLNIKTDRKALFPAITNFDGRTIDSFIKAETIEDVGRFKSTDFIEKELERYRESFNIHNDVTCVYSYLKLKEQEIKNILWIIECVLQDRRSELENIFGNK